MAGYAIHINEEQRKMIETALAQMNLNAMWPNDKAADEGELLREMFAELPKAESELPGCLHGFCL